MIKKFVLTANLWLLVCAGTLIAQPDPGKSFRDEGLSGSITVYDLKKDKWIFSNKNDSAVKSLPASTFKILNSLIALEEKVIRPEEVLKWDGKDKMFRGKSVQSWNSDTDIGNAFKNSTIWFYVELAKKINREKYKEYLKKINYGNSKLTEKGDDFWNYGEFAVSPEEQIAFLVRLYKNTLPFKKENMDYIKSIMVQEKNDNYTLRAKTGWCIKNDKEIGWYIGYAEVKGNAYFFATRIAADTKNMPRAFAQSRKNITVAALKELGFIK